MASNEGVQGEMTRCPDCDDERRRPFKCSVCDKRYRKRHQLKYHEFKHTGILPFTCAGCSKKFRTFQQFTEHVLHSKDDSDEENSEVSVIVLRF